MSAAQLTDKEKFLAGVVFIKKDRDQATAYQYKYDGECGISRLSPDGELFKFYCLCEKIDNETFTAYMTLMETQTVRCRMSFDKFSFIEENPDSES